MTQRPSPRTVAVVLVGLLVAVGGIALLSTALAADATVESGDSIQSAIDEAADGDVIEVEPGTYEESITITTPNVTLTSTDGASSTAIVADNASAAVNISADNVTVDGFELRNTLDESTDLHVVHVDGAANATVTNNTVVGIFEGLSDWNRLITVDGDDATIADNTISADITERDRQTDPNAIHLAGGTDATVANNTIGSTLDALGTGLYVTTDNATIVDNDIVAFDGIAVAWWDGAPGGDDVEDLTIESNNLTFDRDGIGLYNESLGGTISGDIAITHNNFHWLDTADPGYAVFTASDWDDDTFGAPLTAGEVDATDNWWGNETGPSGEGSGVGAGVSEAVDFDDHATAAYGTVFYLDTIEVEDVKEDETIEVAADIENVGDTAGSLVVTLEVGNGVTDETTLDLDAGDDTTHTFEVDAGDVDVGTHEITVATAHDVATDEVEVAELEPATFAVDISHATDSVAPGENIVLDVAVTNTGDEHGEQTVELIVDGEVVDSSTVALDAGESTSVFFMYEATGPDAGELELVVESEDDSDTTWTTVSPIDPAFDVAFTDYNASVNYGEPIEASVEVENTGSAAAEQTIVFSVDGEEFDETAVNLSEGETSTLTHTIDTTADDIGELELTVASDDHNETVTVSVLDNDPASFEPTVDAAGSDAHLAESATGDIVVEVANVGDLEGTAEVSASLDGTELSSATVEIDGQSSAELTLPVDSADLALGENTITIETQDADTEWTIEVVESVGAAEIDIADGAVGSQGTYLRPADGPVSELVLTGDPGDGTVSIFELSRDAVTPPADMASTALAVDIFVPDTATDSPATLEFEVDISDLDGFEHAEQLVVGHQDGDTWDLLETEVVDVSDDTATVRAETAGFSSFAVFVTSAEPPAFAVDAVLSYDDPLAAGDTVDVVTTLENTGELTGEHTYEVSVDGDVVYEESLTVEPGDTVSDTATVTLPDEESVTIAVDGTEVDTLSLTTTDPEVDDDGLSLLEVFALVALYLVAIAVALFAWKGDALRRDGDDDRLYGRL